MRKTDSFGETRLVPYVHELERKSIIMMDFALHRQSSELQACQEAQGSVL